MELVKINLEMFQLLLIVDYKLNIRFHFEFFHRKSTKLSNSTKKLSVSTIDLKNICWIVKNLFVFDLYSKKHLNQIDSTNSISFDFLHSTIQHPKDKFHIQIQHLNFEFNKFKRKTNQLQSQFTWRKINKYLSLNCYNFHFEFCHSNDEIHWFSFVNVIHP